MNYYNEFDPKAAAWLRELIAQGLIPYGHVDERSITEIHPDELLGYDQCHFFAGIGGWPLALQIAGVPAARPLWTGSCPCQPFSSAGRQRGADDERHLWPEFFRLIQACRPPLVFGEQVAGAQVIGKAMQNVRAGKATGVIQKAQQGWVEGGMQGLRESSCAGDEAVAIGQEEDVSGKAASDAPRILACKRCGTKGEGEGHTVRSGLARHSGPRGGGGVRGDGSPVRLGDTEGMERAIAGPDCSTGRVHEGEHEGCPVCPQHDGEQLGSGSDSYDCGRDEEETVLGRVEQIIRSSSGEFEAQAGGVWLDGVRDDLARAHYTFGASVMAACSVSAPHIRQRLYWVATGGMADAESERRERGQDAPEPHGRDGAQTGGATGGMAHADGGQRRDGGLQPCRQYGQQPEDGCTCGAEHAESDGREQRRPESGGRGFTGRCGAWDSFDLLPCTDGKARRVESGAFPLVAGIPKGVVYCRDSGAPINPQATAEGRSMRLRGYGNSIVPQLAAEFILASLDAIGGV